MKERFVEPCNGALLRCQPLQTPGGKFAARLQIMFAANQHRRSLLITPNHEPFTTARQAADFALQLGTRVMRRPIGGLRVGIRA